MRFVKQAQYNLHNYFLNQSLDKVIVKRKPRNYSDVQSIGIVFDSTQPEDRMIVHRYADQLRLQGKKVKLLAYFDDKRAHNNSTFKYFTKNELDWLSRPKGNDVEKFIETAFDILVNLNLKANVALEYIAAMSKAHLRVGPLTNKTFCYDIMIDTKNELDLNFFIKEIEFYLKRLNSSKHEFTEV